MIADPSQERPDRPDFGRLIQAIGASDRHAERELVERFKGHVRRLLVRTLGPGPEIDDLMQEALFRVFRRLSKVHPPDALPGYVTSVTILVAREALRKRRRARWLSFFTTEDLAEAARGAEDIPEDVRAFYASLGKLSEHAQLAITLRYVEGMGLEEMAVAMDVSLATVKRHLKQAEESFVATLGDEEHATAPWLRGVAR